MPKSSSPIIMLIFSHLWELIKRHDFSKNFRFFRWFILRCNISEPFVQFLSIKFPFVTKLIPKCIPGNSEVCPSSLLSDFFYYPRIVYEPSSKLIDSEISRVWNELLPNIQDTFSLAFTSATTKILYVWLKSTKSCTSSY